MDPNISAKSRIAPAKINFTLEVGGRRPDGYHNLHSIVAPLGLSDLVSIELLGGGDKRSCCVVASNLTPAESETISGPHNLAFRAAELLLGLSPATRDLGFRIEIEKRIPLEAGLGGGSSDAAATVALLVSILNIPLTEALLLMLAERVGSDVPCLIRPGIKLVAGRGEQLTEIELSSSARQFFNEDLQIGLVKPPRGVATAEAYAWLKRDNELTSPQLSLGLRRFISLLQEEGVEGADFFEGLRANLRNDFQGVVASRHSEVRAILETAGTIRGVFPLLSGSGSTVIIFGHRCQSAMGRLLDQFADQGFFTHQTAIALTG